MGEELRGHLLHYKGSRMSASCSVWMLLYHLLLENKYPVGTVAFTGGGKPYFADVPVYFSLSHSKDLCAAAISNRPVGVDIEYCRTSYKPHMIERSLTEAEKEAFDGDFTRIWCRKEAVAKMTGKGITGFPTDIDTTKYIFEEQLTTYLEDKYWLVAAREQGNCTGW